jgi:hypothetical protein
MHLGLRGPRFTNRDRQAFPQFYRPAVKLGCKKIPEVDVNRFRGLAT